MAHQAPQPPVVSASMRWWQIALVALGLSASVTVALIPTTAVYGSDEFELRLDCGAPVTHAFGETHADEAVPIQVFSFNEVSDSPSSCRDQSRLRLGLAGGLALVTVVVAGAFVLRGRRHQNDEQQNEQQVATSPPREEPDPT